MSAHHQQDHPGRKQESGVFRCADVRGESQSEIGPASTHRRHDVREREDGGRAEGGR